MYTRAPDRSIKMCVYCQIARAHIYIYILYWNVISVQDATHEYFANRIYRLARVPNIRILHYCRCTCIRRFWAARVHNKSFRRRRRVGFYENYLIYNNKTRYMLCVYVCLCVYTSYIGVFYTCAVFMLRACIVYTYIRSYKCLAFLFHAAKGLTGRRLVHSPLLSLSFVCNDNNERHAFKNEFYRNRLLDPFELLFNFVVLYFIFYYISIFPLSKSQKSLLTTGVIKKNFLAAVSARGE